MKNIFEVRAVAEDGQEYIQQEKFNKYEEAEKFIEECIKQEENENFMYYINKLYTKGE